MKDSQPTSLTDTPSETHQDQGHSAPTAQTNSGEHSYSTSNTSTQGISHQAGDLFGISRIESQRDRKQRRAPGRRSRTHSLRKRGRYIGSRQITPVSDLALDATLRVAAPYQRQRLEQRNRNESKPEHELTAATPEQLPSLAMRYHPSPVSSFKPKIIIYRNDLRQKVRSRRTRNAVCFVVDASWSMAAEERMCTTKAAVLSLLRDAYQRRDRVGLVSFQRDYAQVLLPLTSSVELAQKCLQTMPTGGKTPLAHGLMAGYKLLHQAQRQDIEVIPLLVLITDGQANVSMGHELPQTEAYQIADFIASEDIRAIVIDTEHPNFDRGLARYLAKHLKGQYFHLDDLREGGLAQVVYSQMIPK